MHDHTLPTRRDGVAVRPLKGTRLTRPVSAITVAGRHSPAAVAMLEALGGPGSATPEGQRISISP